MIENPVNPFTGKTINNDEKAAHDQYIIMSYLSDITENNGNTYIPSAWFSVKDDIWNKDNWTYIGTVTALSEHAVP